MWRAAVIIDLRWLAGLLLAFSVSACTTSNGDKPGDGTLSALPVPAPVPEAPPPRHPKRPRAAAGQPSPTAQIDDIVGLNEAEIRGAFGVPAEQEDHAPTKFWVYRTRQCTLNVTLYPEVETRQFHALNYEIVSDDGSAKRQQACAAEFSSHLSIKSAAK